MINASITNRVPRTLTLATLNVENLFGSQPTGASSRLDQPIKSPESLQALSDLILATQADAVGLQEVNDAVTLGQFTDRYLGDLYPYQYVSQSHNHRAINTAIISKYPLEQVKCHPAPHPGGRDVL